MFSAGVGSRSQFSKLSESVFKTVRVCFQNCRSPFFKTPGVGVGFLKLLESESFF